METQATPDVYRAIPGFPHYCAGSDGSVISSHTGKKLRPQRSGRYAHVVLCDGGKKSPIGLHVAIASAWLGPRPDGMVVNHKDCDPFNNRPENLEWVTQSANVQYSYDLGHRVIDADHRERAASLGRARRLTTAEQERDIRAQYTGKRGQITAIARATGLTRDVVRRAIQEGQ